MIKRDLQEKLRDMANKLPAVAVIGPRQSGKTTLVRETFADYHYISLENFDNREYAEQDPRGFLAQYANKVIIDEVQNVPKLFSYIQGLVDEHKQPGMYILTGSQNFLLLEKITQTLAGRIALLTLLPFSIKELHAAKCLFDLETLLFTGCYPRLYQTNLLPKDWYPNYIQTYIERDIRQIKNIHDLNTFQRFVKMCAARTGQLLNLSSLANDCGITHNTAKAWIALLEASFIVFLIYPYYKNFGKRLIKSPKLYFYDPGLVCSLLGIEHKEQLITHYLRGALFESMVIAELIKAMSNQGKAPAVYYWRDQLGHEIDCIIEQKDKPIAIEIKSSKTIVNDYFTNLKYWRELSGTKIESCYVIYGGVSQQQRSSGTVLSWLDLVTFDISKKSLVHIQS